MSYFAFFISAKAQVAKTLLNVYGEKALKDTQYRNWFDKFRSGDFSLKDEQRSGRSNEVDDVQIKAIIELDRHVTVLEIDEMLKIPKLTIDCHIQRLGRCAWPVGRRGADELHTW